MSVSVHMRVLVAHVRRTTGAAATCLLALAANGCKYEKQYDYTPGCESVCPDGTNRISGSTTVLDATKGAFSFVSGGCETVCEPVETCLAPNVPTVRPNPQTGRSQWSCDPLEGFSSLAQDAQVDTSFGAAYVAPAPAVTLLAVGDGPTRVAAGDIDGDGLLDLITGNVGSEDVSVLMATAAGVYAAATSFGLPGAPHATALADLDGDGADDLVVVHAAPVVTNPFVVAVALSDGFAGFGALTPLATATGVAPGRPVDILVGRLDQDAALDFIVSSFPADGGATVFVNDGAAGFAPRDMTSAECQSSYSPGCDVVRLADVEGDGVLELLTIDSVYGRHLSLHTSTGAASWTYSAVLVSAAERLDAAVFVDADRDAAVDLATVEGGRAFVRLDLAPPAMAQAPAEVPQACEQEARTSLAVAALDRSSIARAAPDCNAVIFWSFDGLQEAHALVRPLPSSPADLVAGRFATGSTPVVAVSLPNEDRLALVRR